RNGIDMGGDVFGPNDGGSGRGGGGGGNFTTSTMPSAPATMSPPRANMIAMRRVWTRIAAISNYDGVHPSITKSITDSEAALAKKPDSRETHRALVQALSYAGDIDKATDVAKKWLERDELDPQALGYIADLEGRNGERDRSLRTLAGLVDLAADK